MSDEGTTHDTTDEAAEPAVTPPLGLDGRSLEEPELTDVGDSGDEEPEEPIRASKTPKLDELREELEEEPEKAAAESLSELQEQLAHERGKSGNFWRTVKEQRDLIDKLIPFYQRYQTDAKPETKPENEVPDYQKDPVGNIRAELLSVKRALQSMHEDGQTRAQAQAAAERERAVIAQISPHFDPETGDKEFQGAYQHLSAILYDDLAERYPASTHEEILEAVTGLQAQELRNLVAQGKSVPEFVKGRARRLGFRAESNGKPPGKPSAGHEIAARAERERARGKASGPASPRAAAAPAADNLRELARDLSEDEYLRRRIKGKIKDDDIPQILPGELEGSWYGS